MKTLIIVLSVFLTVSTVASAQKFTKHSKKEVQKTAYTCSMHPEKVSLTEGGCIKCSMKMIKTTERKYNHAVKGSQASSKIVIKYFCTMDGATSEISGKFSKCGVEMTKQEVNKTTYVCPMHTDEVNTAESGCNKCGMKMVMTTKLNHDTAGKGKKTSIEVITKYVCTMDGATSDKPENCLKCEMKMTDKKDNKK